MKEKQTVATLPGDSAITASKPDYCRLSPNFDQPRELLCGLLQIAVEQMLDLPDVVFAVLLPAARKPQGSQLESGGCTANRPNCVTASAKCGAVDCSWPAGGC